MIVDIFYLFNRDKLESMPNRDNVSGCREGQILPGHTEAATWKQTEAAPTWASGRDQGEQGKAGTSAQRLGEGGLREAVDQLCCSITGTGAGGPGG